MNRIYCVAAVVFPLTLAIGVPLVACSSAADEGAAASSQGALIALSPSEIVGTLTYGQTSAPVAYRDTPRYRAFKFSGTKGDAISALVTSTSGHPDAWILDADFSTLASGPANGLWMSETVTATLPSTGTFYVAFRDYFQEDATFVVSLARSTRTTDGGAPIADAGADGGGDSGLRSSDAGTSDAGKPDECTGAPITRAEVEALFAPDAGTATLSTYSITVEHRSCAADAGAPCSAWAPTNAWYAVENANRTYTDVVTTTGLHGTIQLSPVPGVYPTFDINLLSEEQPSDLVSSCDEIFSGEAQCGLFESNSTGTIFPGPVPSGGKAGGGQVMELGQGLITNHCARFIAGGGPNDEYQAVLTSKW